MTKDDHAALPRAPMSFAQERIWLHSQTEEGSLAQALPLSDDIEGPLRADILRDCLSFIVKRHEILRTTFAIENGLPVQLIHPATPVELPVTGLDDDAPPESIEFVVQRERKRVTNLQTGPLIRFSLLRIGSSRHRLIRTCHHIIWDARSTQIFLGELALLYQARVDGKAFPLPEAAAFQAGEAARRERDMLAQDPHYSAKVRWWRGRVTQERRWLGLFQRRPIPELPFARPEPIASVEAEDCFMRLQIPGELCEKLEELRQREGTTLYVIWLAAVVALLAHWNHGTANTLGTYMTTRRGLAMRDLIGFCTNLVTLRLPCNFRLRGRAWLARVGKEIGLVRAHSLLPYEELRKEIERSGGTMLPVQAILDAPLGYGREDMSFAGLTFRWSRLPRPREIPWGFGIFLDRAEGGQICRVEFDARKYDPARIRDFTADLLKLLQALAEAPHRPLKQLLSE